MEDYKNLFPQPPSEPDAAAPAEPESPVMTPPPDTPAVPDLPVMPDVPDIPAPPDVPVTPEAAAPAEPAPTEPVPAEPAPASPAPAASPAADEGPVDGTKIGGAFYGNPAARPASPAPQPVFYVPQPPPPENPPINKSLYIAAFIAALLIFLLCMYCIGADLIHGVIGEDGSVPGTGITIQMQEKPDLNPDDENVTADGEYTVKGVAELVRPSIVEVYAFSAEERIEENLEGTGSGIIITEDGYIITNAHVVTGECFTVILDNEEEYEAEVIGADNKTDLAVLKIEATGLTPAVLGNSDEVYVGESVVAIGNPAGLTGTVTKGIVSATGRKIRAESTAFVMECIQTDAAISPGNSGGALINMYGQVIGITSSKYAADYVTGGTYEGLGFAITTNQALPIIEELMSQGYVSGRFRIGITFMEAETEYSKYYFETEHGFPMPDELSGLWISEISEDCVIANTELQANDFILSMNGVSVANYDEVIEVLDGFKGGDTVTADCARLEEDGDITYFTIEFKLEEDTSGNF